MNKQTEALKMAIKALEKCKEAYLAGPNWQKVGYDILDKSQQACKEALEQPAQEPFGWVLDDGKTFETEKNDYHERYEWTPLYIHPAPSWQRNKEFVGLSDDEIHNLMIGKNGVYYNFARAIEQALKEKNT